MPQRIIWSEIAKSQLRSIDQVIALRILHALARLLATGEGDLKRLQDIDPPEFRLRVGDYRVRFRTIDHTVQILSVKHRSQAYR